MQKAKRVQNYWETLTAPYTQYGFDTIINNQNKSSSSDEREEGNQRNNNRNKNEDDDDEDDDDMKQNDNINTGFLANRSNKNRLVSSPMNKNNKKKKKHESKKQKKTHQVLSNIKKRHKRGEGSPLQSPNKRRRLNNNQVFIS